MGFAPSPYNSVKMALIVEEVSKGNRWLSDKGCDGRDLNPFQWESVKWNLPGYKDYDPSVSWLTKRRKDGRIACDIFTFVDDERVTGPDQDLAWQASHALASTQSYLGVQDAARKARPCVRSPGAWAGSVVHIAPHLGVCVLVSRDKWARMKAILAKWKKALATPSPLLSHEELLSDRGFLVYVTRIYPAMIPYLKGFHLTIEMWRGGRDADGWKSREDDDCEKWRGGIDGDGWKSREDDDCSVDSSDSVTTLADSKLAASPPPLASGDRRYAPVDGLTTPAPRLEADIDALTKLSRYDVPPLRVVRPTRVVHVYYGFGDASGKQYGATISADYNKRSKLSSEAEDCNGVRFRIGLWSAEEEDESSNFKELCNLVETISKEAVAGRMQNCEFFLFTDNSTAEACFHRGTSQSRLLHSLVLSLRVLELEYGMFHTCLWEEDDRARHRWVFPRFIDGRSYGWRGYAAICRLGTVSRRASLTSFGLGACLDGYALSEAFVTQGVV